ncbi:MAG: AAA domain-containing protein [Myxococcota bacterium]
MSEPTELHPHLHRLHRALRDEQAADEAEHRRLDALDADGQVAAGHAWPPLKVQSSDRAGRTVRSVVRATRGVSLHDGISAGDAVWIDVHGEARPGWVDAVDAGAAEVSSEGDELPEGAPLRIRRRHDPATYVRYRKALEAADQHRSPLRRVLLGEQPMVSIERPVRLPGLDDAQAFAAGVALHAPELAVIHGPPGTGKTWLSARVLAELVRNGDRPWALAESNAAVDHLALRAAEQGLRVVRIGVTARIRPEVEALTLDARIRTGPLGPALKTLERDLRRAWGTAAGARLLVERNRLRQQARAEALASAQVIACTLGTLARVGADLPRAVTALIDEATQATEPAVFTVVPWVDRVVLVGDPCQLGPVARVPGSPLGSSMLERLVRDGVQLPMLAVQHRMAPEIRALVSDVYGPAYVDGPGVARGEPQPAVWVDTAGAGGEQRDPVSLSYFEPLEVEIVGRWVERLRAEGLTDLAVIAPYSAQVARLRASPALAGVEVATVNGFQGRERDAVIASWVRSNPDGELGFVADDRRLTVALTRARRRLVLVGDTGTLARHPRFARLVDALAARDAIRSVWEDG